MMKNLKKNRNGSVGALVVCAVLLVLAGSILGMYLVNVAPAYNKGVHGYMEAARWTDNITEVKGYLIDSKQGMMDLGLTNDSNSKIFGWEQTIGTSMATQYKQMDAQIARCISMEAMNQSDPDYQRNYAAGLKDVHDYIYDANGWGDDIANGVFDNMNLKYWIATIILGILALIAFLIALE